MSLKPESASFVMTSFPQCLRSGRGGACQSGVRSLDLVRGGHTISPRGESVGADEFRIFAAPSPTQTFITRVTADTTTIRAQVLGYSNEHGAVRLCASSLAT